jgi:hypothetical protein
VPSGGRLLARDWCRRSLVGSVGRGMTTFVSTVEGMSVQSFGSESDLRGSEAGGKRTACILVRC